MAVAATVEARGALAVGDDTESFRNYTKGRQLVCTGTDSATVDLPAVAPDGKGVKAVGIIDLITPAGAGTNTFALPAGVHGQEILLRFKTKTGGNAVVSPAAGVSMIQGVATAVATITMSAANKYAILSYTVDRWVVRHSDAVLA